MPSRSRGAKRKSDTQNRGILGAACRARIIAGPAPTDGEPRLAVKTERCLIVGGHLEKHPRRAAAVSLRAGSFDERAREAKAPRAGMRSERKDFAFAGGGAHQDEGLFLA